MPPRILLAAVFAVLLPLLVACGNRGPLYLPDTAQETSTSAPETGDSDADGEEEDG